MKRFLIYLVLITGVLACDTNIDDVIGNKADRTLYRRKQEGYA